jgi:hypothetical protein
MAGLTNVAVPVMAKQVRNKWLNGIYISRRACAAAAAKL